MPYIRDKDFTRIRELIETIREISPENEHSPNPDVCALAASVAARALKIIEKYIVEVEEEKEG